MTPRVVVIPPRITFVRRDLKRNEENCWPSLSVVVGGIVERRDQNTPIRAVATTGTFATVNDIQSSTSAEINTLLPPVRMMYTPCTIDTIVVTTMCVRLEHAEVQGNDEKWDHILLVEKMKIRRLRSALSLMSWIRRSGRKIKSRSDKMSATNVVRIACIEERKIDGSVCSLHIVR